MKSLTSTKYLRLLCFCGWISLIPALALSQSIRIDEDFTDWSTNELIAEDPNGDAGQSGIDLTQLWIANDEEHLFVRFNTKISINLQQSNLLRLFIDIDNDMSTGEFVDGIGADLYYDFGMREGKFVSGNQITDIEHQDIGLHSAPTVTANDFELALSRKFKVGTTNKELGGTIAVCLKDLSFNGDQIPSTPDVFQYSMKSEIPVSIESYSFVKDKPDHVRLMSYNSLFDGFFKFPSGDAQARIIKALNPDIIAFQEIYNHTANETAAKIEALLPLPNNGIWHRSKISPDIICISRFPIVFTDAIDGNGIFIMKYKDTHFVLLNAHLPCCDHDEDRQKEIDFILYYLKKLIGGEGTFQISENSPIIIVGDMNLVGDAQQQKSLITGDIIDESSFGSDLVPDWNGDPFLDANPAIVNSPFNSTWSNAFSSYPPGRLDYQIYSGSVLEVVNAFVLQTANLNSSELSMFGLDAGDSAVASDHFPVIVDYEIDSAVPIKEFNKKGSSEFRIFPNPADQLLNIHYTGNSPANMQIELFDSRGRLVKRWICNFNTINSLELPNLANGLYKLRITMDHKLITYSLSIIQA